MKVEATEGSATLAIDGMVVGFTEATAALGQAVRATAVSVGELEVALSSASSGVLRAWPREDGMRAWQREIGKMLLRTA